MSFDYQINSNTFHAPLNRTFTGNRPARGELLTNPINTISEKIDKEKNKKSTRNAIIVSGIVAFTIGMVALFNPRYSSNLTKKLQKMQVKISDKISKSSDNVLKSKFYKLYLSLTRKFIDMADFVNNFNPFKDIIFKNLCTKEGEFLNIKNISARKKFKAVDKERTKITGRIHNGITKWFDNIAKRTVKNRYSASDKELSELENLLKQSFCKLSKKDKIAAQSKLTEIAELKKYYSAENIDARLNAQADCMKNLERDFMSKLRTYGAGYGNKWIKKGEHIIKNMYYWPEEIMMPQRNKVEQAGLSHLNKLLGENEGTKGLYNQIIELLSPNLSTEEKKVLNNAYNKASKKLNIANHSECVEYFDKKRDLIMGSAPTDIFTALISLIISGIVVASTDDNKKKASRLITGVIPVIGGVTTSLVLTSKMISGGKNLLYALLASLVFNRIGVLVDKHILGNNEDDEIKPDKSALKNQRKGETPNV